MSVIGRFQQKGDGYSGAISTLAWRVNPVRFVKRPTGANFSIHGPDDAELGLAWHMVGEFGEFLWTLIDCPSLAAPVNAFMSLKAGDDGSFRLRWQRCENGGDAQ